jgi:hypothetical protein
MAAKWVLTSFATGLLRRGHEHGWEGGPANRAGRRAEGQWHDCSSRGEGRTADGMGPWRLWETGGQWALGAQQMIPQGSALDLEVLFMPKLQHQQP